MKKKKSFIDEKSEFANNGTESERYSSKNTRFYEYSLHFADIHV